MPTLLTAQSLTVRYEGSDTWVLDQFALQQLSGKVTALVGPSGCGKTTFIRTSCGLIPHSIPADYKGTVQLYANSSQSTPLEIADASVADLAINIAYVGQNPDAGILTDSVWKEVCFTLQNLCLSKTEIETRAKDALERVDLWKWRHENPWHLSGGNRQRLSLDAAIATQPQLLVLDEPTSTIDDTGRVEFYRYLSTLKHRGLAILVVDHDIDPALKLIDQVVALGKKGEIIAQGTPATVFTTYQQTLAAHGIWLPRASRGENWETRPQLTDFCAAQQVTYWRKTPTGWEADTPTKAAKTAPNETTPQAQPSAAPLLEIKKLSVPGRSPELDLELSPGEIVALVGANGSGKTSFLSALAGILKFQAETAQLAGKPLKKGQTRCGYVFQNPEHQFVTSSVLKELEFGGTAPETVQHLLQQFQLAHLKDRHPLTLSGGQARRLSVATMAGQNHPLILLDEPTYGQDWDNTQELMDFIVGLKTSGKTIIFATHDLELATRYANRIIAYPLHTRPRQPSSAPPENCGILAQLNPFTLFGAALPVIAWLGLNHFPLLNVAVLVLTSSLIALSGKGLRKNLLLIGLLWAATLLLTGTTSQMVMPERAAVDGYWHAAFDQASMLTAIISLVLVSGIATDPEKILRNAVTNLRLPVRIAVAGTIALSFVARFTRDFQQLRTSRALRGVGQNLRLLAPAYRWVSAIIPLVIVAVGHSERVATAMDARGFGAFPTRTELVESPWRLRDTLVLVGTWLVVVTIWILYPTPASTIYG